jgi:hypothetical protein
MTSIRTTPIRTLLTIVGILATMLMVLLTAPDSAQARQKIEGGDSLAIACRGLRNDADALIDEYGRPGTTGARREEIISELQNIGRDWRTVGCQEAYGDIARITGKPTGGRPGSSPSHAGNAGVAHGPTQSPKPPIHAQPQSPKPPQQAQEAAPQQYNV